MLNCGKVISFAIVAFVCICVVAAQDIGELSRTWTSADGSFTVDAELIDIRGRTIRLRKSDGDTITVPLTKISESDREYVRNRQDEMRQDSKRNRDRRPATANTSPLVQRNVASLNALLEPVRQKYGIPALAAAVVQGNQIVGVGAVGVRQMDSAEEVTVADKFHHGSISKPMTSMLLGMLVDRGKLNWNTTVAQAFPELIDKIRPEYVNATLEHFLLHRSGLPSDRRQSPELSAAIREVKGNIVEQRKEMVEIVLKQPPVAPLGAQHVYANFGFCVAAAMAEAATGQSWEDMMSEMIFKPLKMETAGFGPPSSPDEIDQPRGHIGLGAEMKPASPTADNAPCMGPSSRVHCSVTDLALFGQVHLQYGPVTSKLVSRPTFVRLHTDQLKQNYGLGWTITNPEWVPGELHWHTGTNGMNYSGLYVVPARNMVVVVAMNAKSSEACTEVRDLILRL
ncbi:beta-lactamase [Rhodopirellula maiorica SM1]|uniref:Beta-lactamase n=1 Tax=Rhodopirellula maiorica SM1 TaxID=1265738 RepID=M5RXG5_9BACT|nr:serine hydrolase [Rhodopirellula maiorica]EMI18634.1 beta-lactamase [Rhodopirellula maiorica SM1]